MAGPGIHRKRAALACAVLAACTWLGGDADASPYTEVTSAFDPGDGFDLTVSLEYGLDVRRAAIKREFVGLPGTLPTDPIPVVRDLYLKQATHTLTPRFELGVFTDLSLSLALPIVVLDSRTLELDQRASPCTFPPDPMPSCVDRSNSTTIQDGLLPTNGFDADDPAGPGFTDPNDPTIFRGPDRAGVDQLHLGIQWAPMNQERDDTKPTWKVGAEFRLGVGKPMALDRGDPDSETSVGRGQHEVRLWSSLARRLSWAEPFVELWWQATMATTSDSAFRNIDGDFGQKRTTPQQIGGTRFGFEAIAWDEPKDGQRVSFEFSARLEANFEGRAYTDMWEVFQYAGDVDFGGPLVLDENPVQGGQQARSYPGVSNVENYLEFAGRFGLEAALGDKVRLGAAFELSREQSHLISFADAGVDLPTCGDGRTTDCEDDSNTVVNPGTEEVNPFHVPVIDLVGHRYRVDEVFDYILLVDARVLF